MIAERDLPAPALRFGVIDAHNASVGGLLDRLGQQTIAFRHQVPFQPPRSWFGAYHPSGKVFAALGFDAWPDGTIEVRYAVAEPTRLGATVLPLLFRAFDQATTKKRVVFYTEYFNARMRRMAKVHGFAPCALMYERSGR